MIHRLQPSSLFRKQQISLLLSLLLLPILLVSGITVFLTRAKTAHAAGVLTVEIVSGYNLVVDSNVLSPSTYAPSVATVMGRFCNTGDTDLTNVQGFIGDFGGSSPGLYPTRATDGGGPFDTQHPHLAGTPANYSFTHVGGAVGPMDATRFMGSIPAGACRVQYWHLVYPRRSNLAASNDNAGPDPVWGDSNNPDDDLWLEFDIWGTSNESNANATRRMTMRNEISASANKIKPNPDGVWFNTDTNVVEPGQVITSNGVWYELGVANKGFDNDGDFAYDYNAWLQPFGDPAYDPTCFRLIRASGVITASRSGGNPDTIIPFDNQLYFSTAMPPGPTYSIPTDNNGVRGVVRYTFMAIGGACTVYLTPYQEVASGADNEKFNADFGIALPPVQSSNPQVIIDKSSSPDVVQVGNTIDYSIPFQNNGTSGVGLPLSTGGIPLVVSDTVPNGMEYVGGSAAMTGVTATPLFSTDSGATWDTADPGNTLSTAPNNLVMIQWWLDDTLPAGGSGTATFQVRVPAGTYTGDDQFVENCADLRFGNGAGFAQACTITVIDDGDDNSVGDFVWQDDDGDGVQDVGEAGIDNITVFLYWDKNGNDLLDSGDILIATTTTAGGGAYLFTDLPDGNYIVTVDDEDPDLPTGYALTTFGMYAADLDAAEVIGTPVADLNADFGFGPVLVLDKRLISADPAHEGEKVTYTIDLINTRPGDGTGQPTSCQYRVWATIDHPDNTNTPPGGNSGNARWSNTPNALNRPDGLYAVTNMNDNSDLLGLSGFDLGPQLGNITGVSFAIYAEEIAEFKAADIFTVRVYSNDAQLGADYDYTGSGYFTQPVGSFYIINQDITGLKAWNWSDFVLNTTEMQVVGDKGGGQGASGDIGLDAAAYVITTDQLCGGPEDTIDPLPMTDTFEPSKVQFLAANPPADSVAGDTITWNNLGPLYAGQTKVISVTFRALEPPDIDADGENDPTTIENCADVTAATFSNGRPVNPANDCVISGLNPTGTIGDLVWNDINGLGDYNPNGADGLPNTADDERGIPNVTVYLYDCGSNGVCEGGGGDDILVATTTTDENGLYLFTKVRDGRWETVVDTTTLPNGGVGVANTYDADTNYDSASGPINLNNNDGNAANDDFLGADFGYALPSLIIGSIWHDWNQSGTGAPDVGEEGLAGITVYALSGGCLPPPTPLVLPTPANTCPYGVTDANGDYVISAANGPDGLPGTADDIPLAPAAGGTTYLVTVDTGTGPLASGIPPWVRSYDTPNGPDGIPNTGDDGVNLDDVVAVTIVPGGLGVADYSYYETGSFTIGDLVFTDWDGDGMADPGEEGIANITVYLYEDENGDGIIDPLTDTRMMTTTTDANGGYTFTNLPDADFIVVVDENDPDLPGTYIQTADPDEIGACSTCDGQGSTSVGPDDLTIDFGYQPTGFSSIGDLVWRDDDGDGVQDGGEPGIPNITVTLYEDSNGDGVIDSGDALIATTTTDANGNYIFTNLPAGDYLVDVDTTDADLPQDGGGSPYVLTTNNDPHAVTLGTGETYEDADFGFTTGGVIGDYIWQDNDGDGIPDLGEPGIPGVVVELQDGICTPGVDCPTTTTDANGLYEFSGLPAGTYTVMVSPPGGFTPSGDPDRTSPCSAGGFPDCDNASTVTLTPGQIDRSRDFGYQPTNWIGDYVWLDQNGDGVQDGSETGIGVVVLELWTDPNGDGDPSDGVLMATTTTDGDGFYTFGNMVNGDYVVVVDASTLPTGVVVTYDQDNGTTSPDGQSGVTIANNNDDTIDFGYQFSGAFSLSGSVYFDGDQDGLDREIGEPGYDAVTMYLWRDTDGDMVGDLLVATTTTDLNGDYTFTNLSNGDYTVSLNASSPRFLGATLTTSSACGGSCDNDGIAYEHVSIAGADVVDVDFGFYGPFGPTAVTLQRIGVGNRPFVGLAWLLSAFALLGIVSLVIRRRHQPL